MASMQMLCVGLRAMDMESPLQVLLMLCGTEASTTNLTNFIYEMHMTIEGGITDSERSVGLTFRSDNQNPASYYAANFRLDGSYSIAVYNKGKITALLRSGHCSSFLQQVAQPNLLDIEAQGSIMNLYVNNVYVTTVTDAHYQRGQIGIDITSSNGPADILFTDLKVWKL